MKSLIANWIFSIIAVLGFAVPAFAGSGENAGTVAGGIGGISLVLLNGQYAFEFGINGSDGRKLGTLCPGHNFVYIYQNENNAQIIYQAIVQPAAQFGSNIYVFWTTDAAGNCHITRTYY